MAARDKVIIRTTMDGHVMVTNPAPQMFDPESRVRKTLGIEFKDDDAILDYILNHDLPEEPTQGRIADRSEIPADRTFRSAWEDKGVAIDVNMPKAREIHRNRLRDMRAPKLAQLDVDYQRADERGDAAEKQSIAQRKQALRDVTADPAIDAAATPEELKAVLPAALR